MTVSWDTYERLKSKGLTAFKDGDFSAARGYLVDAAECMADLAIGAKSPVLRRQREEQAKALLSLVTDCDQQQRNAPASPRVRQREQDEDGTTDAADWLVRERPNVGFDDIAGLDDVKTEIRLKMIYPFARPDLAARYGITIGGGILLYGPPGTGKTMIAKAVAHEIDASFFLISPAQIMSKWVGEAEQNIRKLFDAAKARTPSVIFIDEVEALVPKRKSDASTVMQRVVPQILQELEGFDRKADRALLFVGATNKPWLIDDAMLRPGRLDAKVYVGLPDAPSRFKLLELYLGIKPLADDVDLGELCDRLEGFSGADIRSIAQQAAGIPFMEAIGGGAQRSIGREDVLRVIAATQPSVQPGDLTRFRKFMETGD